MNYRQIKIVLLITWVFCGCNSSDNEKLFDYKSLDSDSLPKNQLTIGQQYIKDHGNLIHGQVFDQLVTVEADTPSLVFKNNVFKRGILVEQSQQDRRLEYRNNLIWDTNGDGLSLQYGDTFVDNVMVMDLLTYNPHFIYVQDGKGETLFRGNIFWFQEPSGTSTAEGDGIMIMESDDGAPEENHVIIERNIFLPNSQGPDGEDSLTCTAFTLMCRQDKCRVTVRRNTIFTHTWGGCNVGETWVSRESAVEAVKSNLFVGDINSEGSKMRNLGNADVDVILAENADYNACYRCAQGTGMAGKGYHNLNFSGSALIGEHDKDDLDPQFIDWTRNPITWDLSLGGPGTMESVAARLEPSGGHTIQDLLDYIRDGYRPQNLELQAAGDPNAGSPDIGAVDISTENITVILPASATEGDGLLTNQGSLTLSTSPATNLTVTLTSSDTSELTVADNIIVSAGSISAQFDLQVIQDQLLDGDQIVRVTARADDYTSGSDTMIILDDEVAPEPTITIDLPVSANEGDGLLTNQGSLTLSVAPAADLSISLISNDTSELTVADNIIVGAGSTSAQFDLQVIQDQLVDGDQTVQVTAQADGYINGSDTMLILDDDVPPEFTISVDLPTSASEGDGLLANQGSLSLSVAPATDLSVTLLSSDISELTVPDNIIVPVGSTSAQFDLQVIQDQLLDGDQTVQITAQAEGYISGYDTMMILDDDVPPELTITIDLPDSASEGSSESLTGDVFLSSVTSIALTVTLESDDTTEIGVPSTLVIPAQSDQATFALTVVDDLAVDGTQQVTINASAAGWQSGQATLNVIDNDTEIDPPEDRPKVIGYLGCSTGAKDTNSDTWVWLLALCWLWHRKR